MTRYDQDAHFLSVLAPVDTTSTTVNTDVVYAGDSTFVSFLIQFGVITGDTAVVTVEECDNTTPSNTTAVTFDYRLSAATGTDTVGAKTAATTAGVTIASSDDGKMLEVFLSPRQLTTGRPYVRCVIDPGGSASVLLVSAVAVLEPVYARSTITSQVD